MIEYVNRDAIKTRLESWQKIIKDKYGIEDEYVRCLDNAIFIVEDVPTADVVEQKHGQWIHRTGNDNECSNCGFQYYDAKYRFYNYCPNCCARMDGET